MADQRTSRDLAERVEADFHRRANPFQRLMWWMSGVAAIVAGLGVLIGSATTGDRIYQAGELSNPHAMFANKCAACHTKWAPLERLVTFDTKAARSSIDEQKCQACHAGTAHFADYARGADDRFERAAHNAIIDTARPHSGIGCAECHREHQGDVDLVDVANAMCVRCHKDLRADGHLTNWFANEVESLATHPQFRFAALLDAGRDDSNDAGSSPHGVYGRLQKFDAPTAGIRSSGWQDKTALAFNHSKHLRPGGILGPDGQQTTLECAACHEATTDKQYFKPIRFESHCQSCHELTVGSFDGSLQAEVAGTEVPHESADLVRGFLLTFYKNLEMGSGSGLSEAARERVRSRVLGHETSLLAKLSGTRGFRPDQATTCGLCHEVARDAGGTWQITPPQIPDRWLPHSRFNHDPHRIVNCQQCHENVAPDTSGQGGSQLTGDVLLPKVEVCRQCHDRGTDKPAGFVGARTNCVECHTYHQREHEQLEQDRTIEQLLKL